MTKVIIYLLESSAVLALLYLLYLLFMRKETLFVVNRFFLLGILAISLVAPLVSYQWLPASAEVVQRQVEDLRDVRGSYYEAMEDWMQTSTMGERSPSSSSTWRGGSWPSAEIINTILMGAYVLGVALFLARLVWTCTWILGLKRKYPTIKVDGIPVVSLPTAVSPFSFLGSMYAEDELVHSTEFQQILEHEKTHIRQRHSVDLLLVQVLGAFWWFNPAIWLIVKSLKQTHEYIADEHIINRGYSLVEYQTLLLRQLISNNSLGLIHHFNLSFIKKRITMMKNTRSGWAGKLRVTLALFTAVVMGAVIVQCNANFESQPELDVAIETGRRAQAVELPVIYDNGLIHIYDTDDAIEITVHSDQILVDGDKQDLETLSKVIAASNVTERGVVIMRIDRAQTMGLVRDVQTILREVNRRKVLYIGVSDQGKTLEIPMLLPPSLNSPNPLPEIDEAYLIEHNMELLKLQLGQANGPELQSTVYQFVMEQHEVGRNYVVSAKFENDDTFQSYLNNLVYISEGFNQIYDERAREMFGKSWAEISNVDLKDNPDIKEQYHAVRKGLPRAISVAEPD